MRRRATFDESRNEHFVLPPVNIRDYYWTEEDSDIIDSFRKEREREIYGIYQEMSHKNVYNSVDEFLDDEKDQVENIFIQTKKENKNKEIVNETKNNPVVLETKSNDLVNKKTQKQTNKEEQPGIKTIKHDFFEIELEKSVSQKYEEELENREADDAIKRAALAIKKEENEKIQKTNKNAPNTKNLKSSEMTHGKLMEELTEVFKKKFNTNNTKLHKNKDTINGPVDNNKINKTKETNIKVYNDIAKFDNKNNTGIVDSNINFEQEGLIEFQDKMDICFDPQLPQTVPFIQLKNNEEYTKEDSFENTPKETEETQKEKTDDIQNDKKNIANDKKLNINTLNKEVERHKIMPNSLVSERISQFNKLILNDNENIQKRKKKSLPKRIGHGIIKSFQSFFSAEKEGRTTHTKKRIVQRVNCFKFNDNPFVKFDKAY
ncbi:hypothetical protein EHP00_1486 [Ecytonucleospora hepatopenaei]|uniref:Uncharacterized protein n=1 Tax=Ecytonucleospora hepatopenaei TaxID=646526 RepID=A0A1W0E8T0_9MICR|nr:hypothetical protein EHP00_1486 [Ecytonucleospora hepatopenaei]